MLSHAYLCLSPLFLAPPAHTKDFVHVLCKYPHAWSASVAGFAPCLPVTAARACLQHPTCTQRRVQAILPTLCGRGGGCPLLCVSHTQDWGFLNGPSVCKQSHNSPAQLPAPLPLGLILPRGAERKKCEKIGLCPPCHQVISTVATWMDLTSPGFVLCLGTHLPSPARTTSAKGCWAAATTWWHGPCLGSDQNTLH